MQVNPGGYNMTAQLQNHAFNDTEQVNSQLKGMQV